MTTSNTNNQGIIHLAYHFGGQPFCRSRRAIMVTVPSEAHKWPRICVRCERYLKRAQERAEKKTPAAMIQVFHVTA